MNMYYSTVYSLQGLCFYSTENVQPSFAHLKEIIECAGGVLWTQAELKNNSLDSLNKGRFFVISAPEDIAAGLCSDFFKHDIRKCILCSGQSESGASLTIAVTHAWRGHKSVDILKSFLLCV